MKSDVELWQMDHCLKVKYLLNSEVKKKTGGVPRWVCNVSVSALQNLYQHLRLIWVS